MCSLPKLPMIMLFLPFLSTIILSDQNLTVDDILKLPVPPPDHRIPYGKEPSQFGDLRLPEGDGPHPVIVVIHGGCWRAKYSLDHISSFCAALTETGYATWSLEYRRLGNPGGGWPGTLKDVACGADHLRELAQKYSLNLKKVIAAGHSAGGHLALWLAARSRLPEESPLYYDHPISLHGIISLAGVVDLRNGEELGACGDALPSLIGGSSLDFPARYHQASPAEFLPLNIRQHLIVGDNDTTMLKLAKFYAASAKKVKDNVQLTIIERAGHFELIAPESSAWKTVLKAVVSLMKSE